jgi:hypothetical protein
MGDITEGGLTVDERTKKLLIRRRELEIKNLEYQSDIARLRADELEVEIVRQHEQAKANEGKIRSIRKEIAAMRGDIENG